jgi:transposase
MSAVTEWKPKDAKGLRGVDPQDIMQRVAEGELIRDIAKDYGVSRSAVSHYIADHTDKKAWLAVREQSIYARLEQAAAELQSITEQVTKTPDPDSAERLDLGRAQLTLACAREAARFWQWRAEKEFGHIFQTKPSTAVNIGGNELSVQLVSYAAPAALPVSTQAIDTTEQSTE